MYIYLFNIYFCTVNHIIFLPLKAIRIRYYLQKMQISSSSPYFWMPRNQYNLILIPIMCLICCFFFKDMHSPRYLSFWCLARKIASDWMLELIRWRKSKVRRIIQNFLLFVIFKFARKPSDRTKESTFAKDKAISLTVFSMIWYDKAEQFKICVNHVMLSTSSSVLVI